MSIKQHWNPVYSCAWQTVGAVVDKVHHDHACVLSPERHSTSYKNRSDRLDGRRVVVGQSADVAEGRWRG